MINFQKVITEIRQGKKIRAIKEIRDNADITSEYRDYPILSLKTSKDIADVIQRLIDPTLEKPRSSIFDFVTIDNADAAIYIAAFNNLPQSAKTEIEEALTDFAEYRLISYFRRLIREYTTRDNPDETLKF